MSKDEHIEALMKENSELKQLLYSLKTSIEQQTTLTKQQSAMIEQLNQTVAELNEKLNKNSKNSSKPPSSDGLKKPVTKSLRQKSGKKPGGQQGDDGANLATTADPDEVKKHLPDSCKDCPNISKCIDKLACVTEKRHVIDAVVTVHVTEHQKFTFTECPFHEGQTLQGKFPSDISATVQYGRNLNALVVALNTVGMVSVNRTHEILGSVFSIPLSTGTISSMVKKCAQNIKNTVDTIRQKVIDSAVGHFDETGTRVEGSTIWVHNSSTEKYTYLTVHKNRGVEGMKDNGVLTEFHGIAVHDCWPSYWKYDITHAVCCAHLLRELTGIEENYAEQIWATNFKELLLEMKRAKEKAIQAEKPELSYYYLHKFDIKYDSIFQEAFEMNPLPVITEKKRGRKKKGKILALITPLSASSSSTIMTILPFLISSITSSNLANIFFSP